MDQFIKALGAYEKVDPVGWVAVYRVLPFWAGLAMVAAGVAMLLFGGGRLFRLVAAPLGALVAMLWTSVVAANLGFHGPTRQLTTAAMVGLFVLGLAYPPLVVFVAVGIPAGLIAGAAVGPSDYMLGFVPAFVAVGAIAAAANRIFGAIASSAAGGWLVVIGALASLSSFGGLSEKVAQLTWGVVAAAGLFAAAGVVFQLFVRLSPDEREALSVQKAQARRKAEDQKKVKERWGKYLPPKDDTDA